MLVHFDRAASSSEIREALESGGPEAKAEAMKKAIAILLSGEQMPQIFITIVRFVLPSDDKYVQKLLLLYMEIIEKTDSSGKLLPEMILICQNLRNNLQHPNEFLRGATLRFLCRITEAEILEPLVPSIVACLEHRHSFVRRNAVLCIDRIYQMPGGDMLLQDAPETIERFLAGGESDLSTRRNAFLMLYNNDQDRAVSFLLQNVEQVANWGDILQNVVLDLIRKVRAFEKTRGESPPRSRPALPSRFALFHEPLASSPTRKNPDADCLPWDPVFISKNTPGVPHGSVTEGQVHQDHPDALEHEQHECDLRVRQHARGAFVRAHRDQGGGELLLPAPGEPERQQREAHRP